MNIQRIFRDFKRLPMGDRLIFFGVVLALCSAFFPWVHEDFFNAQLLKVDQKSYNGFGFFPIFASLSVTFATMSLIIFVHHISGNKKTFSFDNGGFWMFLGGQALFVFLIAFFVFFSSKIYTTITFGFGFFLSLFAHILILSGGFLCQQKERHLRHRSVFTPSPSAAHGHIAPEPPRSNQISFSDSDER